MLSDNPTPKKDWHAKFLATLAKTGNVSAAAKAAKIHRDTAYQHRTDDEAFRKAWALAQEESADELEAEARRRAMKGTKKPVYQQGKLVGHVQEYSDTLLIFLLKGNNPEKFRERSSVEHSGPAGGPIAVREVTVHLPPEPETDEAATGDDG